MTYVLLVLASLLAFDGSAARADPIPIFHVRNAEMFMGPNQGAGDNVLFTFTGPGVDIEGRGGMACFSWCDGNPIPAGVGVQLTQIFVSVTERRSSVASPTAPLRNSTSRTTKSSMLRAV
jgi:hypothetical protein